MSTLPPDLNVHEIAADGNSAFRALSFVLNGTDDQHGVIRHKIVEHVTRNWAHYSNFIVGDPSYTVPIRSSFDYSSYMCVSGVEGGHLELSAATTVYNASVKLFNRNGSSPLVLGSVDPKNKMINLLYNDATGHFSALIPRTVQSEDQSKSETSKSNANTKPSRNSNSKRTSAKKRKKRYKDTDDDDDDYDDDYNDDNDDDDEDYEENYNEKIKLQNKRDRQRRYQERLRLRKQQEQNGDTSAGDTRAGMRQTRAQTNKVVNCNNTSQAGPMASNGGVGQASSKDLQTPPTLTPNMPQPQSNIPRATVNPFNITAENPFSTAADTRSLAPPRAAPMYNQQTLYQYTTNTVPKTTAMPSPYPIHPDVRFKRLPFFDVLSDLIKPSSLVPQTTQRLQENTFYFHLTPAQATDIASNRDLRPDSKLEYLKQVQLRFCLLETSCEQEDFFPPNIVVKVNSKLCPLPNPIPTNKPGVDPKRPPRPVNITPLIKLNPTIPNTIAVSWAADYGRGYVMSVMLVHKLNSTELLQRLKQRGIKHSDYTRGLIKEKLSEDADCEIATTSLRVSLMCPLGKMRMTTPCRPTTCQHLQCFDASLFLQMNERKPTWNCPVCDKPAVYDHLVIDGYFQDVLASASLPTDTNEIQLHKDGSWSSQLIVKKECPVKTEDFDESVQIIDDDVIPLLPEEKPEKQKTSNPKNTTITNSASATGTLPVVSSDPKNTSVVDLTLSDSDDDQVAKRKAAQKPDSTNTFNDATSISSTGSLVQLSTTTTSGSSSVSSSGYRSPSVITLDSPSPPPPTSPPLSLMQQQQQRPSCNQQTPRSSCMMVTPPPNVVVGNFQPSQAQNVVTTSAGNTMYNNLSNGLSPFHDILFDDSNGASNYYPQF